LLLHGLTSAARVWWRIAPALADAGWSVTAPDLRGHGRSPRADSYRFDEMTDDVLALSGPWDLIAGHSMGGALTVLALQRNPNFARRAVLIDPAVQNNPADLPAFLAAALARVRNPDLDACRAENPNWDEPTLQAWAESQREVDPEAVRAILETNRPWDVTAAALQMPIPAHVLAADPARNASFIAADGDRLRQANSNWSYEVVPGTSHSVHRDQPDLVIDRLLRAAA